MKNQRNVKKRVASSSINSLAYSGVTKKEKAAIRAKERLNRIQMNKAKQYLLFAIFCLFTSQIIKYITQNLLFASVETPSGIGFLLVIYLQTGLLLAAFVFFVLSAFKALQRILREVS